jgi:hypothetical protein
MVNFRQGLPKYAPNIDGTAKRMRDGPENRPVPLRPITIGEV